MNSINNNPFPAYGHVDKKAKTEYSQEDCQELYESLKAQKQAHHIDQMLTAARDKRSPDIDRLQKEIVSVATLTLRRQIEQELEVLDRITAIKHELNPSVKINDQETIDKANIEKEQLKKMRNDVFGDLQNSFRMYPEIFILQMGEIHFHRMKQLQQRHYTQTGAIGEQLLHRELQCQLTMAAQKRRLFTNAPATDENKVKKRDALAQLHRICEIVYNPMAPAVFSNKLQELYSIQLAYFTDLHHVLNSQMLWETDVGKMRRLRIRHEDPNMGYDRCLAIQTNQKLMLHFLQPSQSRPAGNNFVTPQAICLMRNSKIDKIWKEVIAAERLPPQLEKVRAEWHQVMLDMGTFHLYPVTLKDLLNPPSIPETICVRNQILFLTHQGAALQAMLLWLQIQPKANPAGYELLVFQKAPQQYCNIIHYSFEEHYLSHRQMPQVDAPQGPHELNALHFVQNIIQFTPPREAERNWLKLLILHISQTIHTIKGRLQVLQQNHDV